MRVCPGLQLDKDRGNYNLKEAKLASALVRACLMDPKTSSHAQAALNWRRGAATKHAGNFSLGHGIRECVALCLCPLWGAVGFVTPDHGQCYDRGTLRCLVSHLTVFILVLVQYLFSKSCGKQPNTPAANELKVRDVNQRLDELVAAEGTEDKVKVLTWLVHHTTPDQMKWITQIILKEMKVPAAAPRVLQCLQQFWHNLYFCSWCAIGRSCQQTVQPHPHACC